MHLATNTPTVTLPASDLARARAFYEGVLGMAVSLELPEQGAVCYRCGGTDILLYTSAYAGTNKATAASWTLDDIDGALAELRAAGVTFDTFDMPGVTWEDGVATWPGFDGKAAWFTDTEGNILNVASPMV